MQQEKQQPFTGPPPPPVVATSVARPFNYSPAVSEAARKLEMEYRIRHVLGLVEMGVLTTDPHSPIILVDTSKLDDNEPVDVDDGPVCGCNFKYVAVIVGLILCIAGLCVALQSSAFGSSRPGHIKGGLPVFERSMIMNNRHQQQFYNQASSRFKSIRHNNMPFMPVDNNNNTNNNTLAAARRSKLQAARSRNLNQTLPL